MSSPTYLDDDTANILAQTQFQNSTDADLWGMSFRLNSEAHINALSSLVEQPSPDQQPAPAAVPWGGGPMVGRSAGPSLVPPPPPLPVELSPHASSSPSGSTSVLGPEFRSWRSSPADQMLAPAGDTAGDGSPVTMTSGQQQTGADMAPGDSLGSVSMANGGDLESYTRSEAQRLGIDPDKAVAVGNTEGGFGDPTRQNTGGAPAYGPYQAYIGGPGNPGLGDEMLAQGIDPRKPEDARRAVTYSLEHAAQNGWGAFQGAAANGIGAWDGIGQAPAHPDTSQQNPTKPNTGTPAALPQASAPASAGWEVDQAALDDADKWALCGPVAAVMAAAKRGGDWSVAEAKRIATASGLWDADTGMHGLGTEVDLLNRMGVSSRLGDADPAKLAADAQAGNTPIVSTNRHYFILKGYDPSTGKFDTATSGSVLRGGSRYLSLDEIARLGGGIQGAAYLDNPASPAPSAVAPPTAGGSSSPAGTVAPATDGSPAAGASDPLRQQLAAGNAGPASLKQMPPDQPSADLPYDPRADEQGPHEWRPQYGQADYATDDQGRAFNGAPAIGSWPGDDQNPTLPNYGGQPAPRPYVPDRTDPSQQPQMIPRGLNMPGNGVADDAMYRQPLGANMGPDTTNGSDQQPYDPDQGPHEATPGSVGAQPLPQMLPVWDASGTKIGYRQEDAPAADPTIGDPNYTGQPAGRVYDPNDPSTGVNPLTPGALRPTDLPPELQGQRPWLPAMAPPERFPGETAAVDTLVPRAAQTGPLPDQQPAPSRWSPQVQEQQQPFYEAAPYQDSQTQPAPPPQPRVPPRVSPFTPGPALPPETAPSDQQILAGQGPVARGIDSVLQRQGIEDQHPDSLVTPENRRAFMQDAPASTPSSLLDWRDRLTVGAADALARGIGADPEQALVNVQIGGVPVQMTVSGLLQNVTDPLFIGGAGVGSVVLDGLGEAALRLVAPYAKGAARATIGRLLDAVGPALTRAGDAIDAGGNRALDALEAGAARISDSGLGQAWRQGRETAAQLNAADAGSRTYGVFGPAPAPGGETRIPGAGYHTDLSPGAAQMIGADVTANAPQEVVHRADVAQKAQDVLGLDPETVQRWQAEATSAAPADRAVRGEALRQARDVDAENASRAIDRLQAAQARVRAVGGPGNLNEQDSADVASALLDAADAARGMQASGAADSAQARAAARELSQRKSAITARAAMQTAERARQVAEDAAFAAREVRRASVTGQVTPQGATRLQIVRDKLLEAERNGLTGDGAGGRLDALEQPAVSTTAAATIGPVPARGVRRSAGLGTRLATDIGNSILGAGTGATAGYLAPANSDEDRRRHAALLAAGGAISFPLVGRMLSHGGGLRAMLGPVPSPEVPNRSLAMGADPARRYEFKYRVADLGDLIASHLPTGGPNPAFPSELQPRARERAASQLQIGRIAQTLDPVALLHDAGRLDSGPPIVGSDNLVESGNGRTLALAKAAQDHPERYQAYVQTLRDNIGEFGLSDKDLEGVQQPVLVRERVTPVDRPSFVAEANGASGLRMSPAEQAAQAAAKLSDAVVTQLHVGENDTIASALRRTENRDLVRQWLGTLPENERAELLDAKGEIAPHGYDALASALLTRTYGEGATTRAFIEAGTPEVRNVQTAVMGSLPDMARAEALIRSGQRDASLSIAQDVAGATEVLARLKQAGMSVGDYVKQVAMGDRELTPFQEQILGFLDQNQRRPAAIRSALREYANVVENAADPNQVDMFGNQVAGLTKEDAWASATAGVQRERQAGVQAQQARTAAENAARGPAADIVPNTGGPEGRLEVQNAPQSVGARPGPVGDVPSGGPEGSLAVQGAPQPTPRPGPLPADVAPRGGPEGRLQQEGAPPSPANLPPVASGSLPQGGAASDLTLSSGRSIKDVAAHIDDVLANPTAPGAVERLQQLHQDLQEISAQGFSRSSQIRQRLQRNGLLRLGLSTSTSDSDVRGLVQALANVDPAHPEQMHAVLQIISKPRLIDRIMEYQYVNMLSSPITQGTNIIANAMQLAGRLLLQNPLEYAFSGGQSTGGVAAFGGAARGFREALPEVGQIMRTGTSAGAINRASETGNYSRVGRELLTEQFGRAGALLHTISTRPLEAMDTLLGHMAYASAADQYAQRTADRLLAAGSSKVAGMSREAARQHVLANIWDYPDVIAKAGKIQDYTLLKSNDASSQGFGILERRLRQMAALGHAPADADFARQVLAFGVNNAMPFFNVPLNTAKQGIERTAGVPVNIVRAGRAYAKGDVEKGAELMSKATIGAAAVTTAGFLAASDNLTGEGPGGPQQAIWEQDHRRNSFRVPGTSQWITWEGTPLAIPFGMVAGARQGWQDASKSADQKGQSGALDRLGLASLKGAQGAVQGFTSQSFIRAMGDQYKLLTGQETGLGTLANQATSNISRFVPASGMVNFLANVTDSMQRDPGRPQSFSDLRQNIGAREAMRIPGAREQVDTRLGPYGQPLRNEQFGVAGALPYYRGAGPGANDPINKTVEAAGVGAITTPAEVPAGVTTGVPIPLSMAQQRVFDQTAGTRFRELLEGNTVGAGGWSSQALDRFRAVARQAGIAAAVASMDPAERQRKVQAAIAKKAS